MIFFEKYEFILKFYMQFHAINCILEKVIHEIHTKQKGTILKTFWDLNMSILGKKIGKNLS